MLSILAILHSVKETAQKLTLRMDLYGVVEKWTIISYACSPCSTLHCHTDSSLFTTFAFLFFQQPQTKLKSITRNMDFSPVFPKQFWSRYINSTLLDPSHRYLALVDPSYPLPPSTRGHLWYISRRNELLKDDPKKTFLQVAKKKIFSGSVSPST
ncbi:hypothetical protein RB195_008963 [Necator americanus]|uniref:Uncharacterized protein n=1 Tax=Necator americanus TaxID=51031 RepID=A0ABR1CR59_NECAM